MQQRGRDVSDDERELRGAVHLVVCIQQEKGGGEQGIALGDEVQPGILPKAGRVVGPHALQLHVQHHLRPLQAR